MQTRLLKALHKCCNTDMLGAFLIIYLHSPLGTVHPWDHAYISVKPLPVVLQYIVYSYVRMQVFTYANQQHNTVC